MKYKTTKKAIESGYYRIVNVRYCALQGLLKYKSPIAYSCGVYGWNGDYYDIGGVCIATGYRSLPNDKNVTCDYELVREYEKGSEGKTKDEIDALLNEFISKITSGS